MKLVRFMKKSFFNNMILEAGEEMLVADDTFLSAHMIDVAALSAGEEPVVEEYVHPPQFLDHSADVATPVGTLQRDGSSPHVDPASTT